MALYIYIYINSQQAAADGGHPEGAMGDQQTEVNHTIAHVQKQ